HLQFLTLPRHLPFRLCHLIATSLQEISQFFNSCSMRTATKVVRCIASFSRASPSPAAALQRGLTLQLLRRFVSPTGKDSGAAVNVDVENRRIDASSFMHNTRLKPTEVGVGNKKAIDIACEHVAKLNGAHPKEIILTSRATGSNDMSIKCRARFYNFKKHIITLQMELKCILDLCRHLQGEGYDITYLPIKNGGLSNLERLE
ncbi:hypothetical protein HOY80DRAFT_1090226, partial [Tuber brumale]